MVRSVAGAGSRTGAGAGARGGAGVGPFLRQRVRRFVAWDVGMTRYPNDLRGCVSKERVEEGLDRPDEGPVCLGCPLAEDDIDSIAIVDKDKDR